MADDRVIVEIVSEFFLKTCQLRRRLNMDTIAVVRGGSLTMDLDLTESSSASDFDLIPLSTGSVAEFYIDPLLPCVGDVDMMVHMSSELAVPQGHLPPTQLPAEFHGDVDVHEIIDSEFPGYVYLVFCYLLTENADDGKYNAVQCEREYVEYTFDLEYGETVQGPAYAMKGPIYPIESDIGRTYASGSCNSLDVVPCIHCLSWPTQAADWTTRHRHYGWPDSATLDRVVSNGCDVVQVAHRLCREHEWMSKHQHRLSFSRAEIVLINSWTQVQQIVYHMIRFFMKTDRNQRHYWK